MKDLCLADEVYSDEELLSCVQKPEQWYLLHAEHPELFHNGEQCWRFQCKCQ